MKKENSKKQAEKKTEKKSIINYLTGFPVPYIIIAILTFIVYYQVINFGLVEFDDKQIIDNANSTEGGTASLVFGKDPYFKSDQNSQFYRPIQNLTILIDSSIKGTDYSAFHLTNLLLHILTAMSLFYLLTLLKYDKLLSMLLSLVFALHPLFSFVVVWIPARGDLLAALFSLLSFIFFIKYLQNQRVIDSALNLLFLILAIFSKEIAFILPVIFIAYYFLVYSKFARYTEIKKTTKLIIVLSWFIPLLLYFVLKSIFLNQSESSYSFGFSEFLSNLRYYPEYLVKFLYSSDLTGVSQFSMTSTLLGCIVIIVFSAFITIKREIIDVKKVIFFISWFIAFLLPVVAFKSSYISTGEYWDHRAYLPLIGIVLLLGEIINSFRLNQRQILIVMCAVIVVFSTITIRASSNYMDKTSFLNNIIDKGIAWPYPYIGRASAKIDRGDNLGALDDINRAIAIKEDSWSAYFKRGRINFNLKKLDEAIKDFNRALILKPGFADAYMNLGVCYFYKHDYNNSMINLRKALEINPEDQKVKAMLNEVQSKLEK